MTVLTCLMMPVSASAQGGGIAGIVRDASGGVLPGVVVEATSPALIEQTRSAQTDGQGRYNIVDLRPGIYVVTFSLTGFSTVKRDGLEVTTGATLPVNAELSVGAVEETVVVSGASPVVDVQNTGQRDVLNRELLDSIPRTRDVSVTAALLPGVTLTGVQDMGGSGGQVIAPVYAHGGQIGDQIWAVDGMKTGGNARRVLVVADSAAQEVTVESSAISAEQSTGGVRINVIPQEGGNTFRGAAFGAYTSHGMTSNNITDELRSRGILASDAVDKIWDVSGSLGGPIVKDRLWFFNTYRNYGSNGRFAGVFFESDPTRQGLNINDLWSYNVRLTGQVSARNKVSVSFDTNRRDQPYRTSSTTQTPEASAGTTYPNMYILAGRWTAPLTSRLLVEAAGSHYYEHQMFVNSPAWPGPGTYPEFEITTSKWTRAAPASGGLLNPNTDNPHSFYNLLGSMSYVTGTHTFKVGFQDYFGQSRTTRPDYPAALRFNSGRPFQVLLSSLPSDTLPRLNYDLGVFAQDQWSIDRLTLNLGVRFDFMNQQVDRQFEPAGTYVGERHYEPIYNVPNWKDVSPRVGFAYDLFGTGKTAIKSSVGRYLTQDITGFAGSVNPAGVSTDTRLWTDSNNDRLPQLAELGPSTNLNFGLPQVRTQPEDDVREGWGKRGYNWQWVTSVQHELRPGLAATVSYHRRWYGNLTWTENTLVTHSNYAPFTIANPIDGEPITLYNLDPALRGRSFNVIRFAPDDSSSFDGVDVSASGRFGRGGLMNGGISMGRQSVSQCTRSDPNQLRFCSWSPGFFAQNQYKFVASYPLPYQIRMSGTIQSNPGPVITNPPAFIQPGVLANYTVTSAIAGIALTNGTIVTPLIEPGTVFGERRNQVDLRVSRTFRTGAVRWSANVDVYNLLNASFVISENATYGPAWRNPTAVSIGRVGQISVQADF
jgi:hypothetical protein